MKAVLIAALMFAVCLTFASPGLSADPDAHPERIVIIGDPMDDRTDIEHMVKGFERISAAKAFYESSGSEVWIEDPSYGIKDRVLGKLASDLKEAIGRCSFIHGHGPEFKEIIPSDDIPVDMGFLMISIMMVKSIDEHMGNVLENIHGSAVSINDYSQDATMINISPSGGERKDDEKDEDEPSDRTVTVENEDDEPIIPFTMIRTAEAPSMPMESPVIHIDQGTIF